MEEDKKRRRKPPLPSKESGYSLCNEAKCTGTPHCRSINSDSDISTVAEPTGLAYAQDTELHSLSATLLLLVKRDLIPHRVRDPDHQDRHKTAGCTLEKPKTCCSDAGSWDLRGAECRHSGVEPGSQWIRVGILGQSVPGTKETPTAAHSNQGSGQPKRKQRRQGKGALGTPVTFYEQSSNCESTTPSGRNIHGFVFFIFLLGSNTAHEEKPTEKECSEIWPLQVKCRTEKPIFLIGGLSFESCNFVLKSTVPVRSLFTLH
ncbi:uncharacterized protein [Ambystoma mexicanum]|uniref:uncharacterized protein isoform X1 n=1 Tax=Ambystoma mexicanum TaxID=8296 RepID=UPI0037E85B7F